MTPQSSMNTGWRRAIIGAMAGGALAAGLMAGSPSALADPSDPTATSADEQPAPKMSADEALVVVANDYDTGAGGGQISVLIHQIMQLRQAGYRPSTANGEALVAALDKRPNQAPLIAALEKTLNFQMRQATRAQAQPQQPSTFGVNPGGIPGDGGALTIPIGP